MTHPRLSPPDPRTRLLCAAGSVALTGVWLGALLGLFDRAAPARWLAPSPELMALMAPCERLADRAERHRCQQAAVLAMSAAQVRRMAAAP